ncbi:MAG: tRNA 2-thiouridine(34) synthase MnmA [Clostridia bacterium]
MRVVLGISGGVDSSVAALLLKQQGYEVIGLFMKNWEETDSNGVCCAEADFADAKAVCSCLDIPCYSINFAKQYQDKVFSYFLEEYGKGRTPNPDVLCNKEIKFGSFLDFALTFDADYIATGHYCGIEHINGLHYLSKAVDIDKDQTYFLNQLNQFQLSKVLFPLQNYTKPQVRQLAKDNNIPTACKKDSTGICFIGERNFRKFMQNYFPAKSGQIVTIDGQVVGEHIGLMFYTLGQRKGLNLGGAKDGQEGRWFVCEKDLSTNRLIVSHGSEEQLYSKACLVSDVNFIPSKPINKQFDCFAKFRYRQQEQPVTICINDDNSCLVTFSQPQRAVTQGQYAVFYDEKYCLGGGVIDKIYK